MVIIIVIVIDVVIIAWDAACSIGAGIGIVAVGDTDGEAGSITERRPQTLLGQEHQRDADGMAGAEPRGGGFTGPGIYAVRGFAGAPSPKQNPVAPMLY